MWYGPFPTLYKNRLPAYYLEGATTWNTQANGRFFLFGFLRKYDKLCAMTIHLCDPFRTLFCSISLVVTWGHVTGCFSRLWQAVKTSAITIHPLKHISRDPTFGTGGISSRNPWRCLKAAFLVSTGTAKEKGWKMCLPSIGAVWCSLILVWNAGDLLGTSMEPPIGTTVSLFTLQQSTWIMRQ